MARYVGMVCIEGEPNRDNFQFAAASAMVSFYRSIRTGRQKVQSEARVIEAHPSLLKACGITEKSMFGAQIIEDTDMIKTYVAYGEDLNAKNTDTANS